MRTFVLSHSLTLTFLFTASTRRLTEVPREHCIGTTCFPLVVHPMTEVTLKTSERWPAPKPRQRTPNATDQGEESPGSKKKAHLLPDSEDEAEDTNEVADEVHERRTADSQEGEAAATLSAQEGSRAGSKGHHGAGRTVLVHPLVLATPAGAVTTAVPLMLEVQGCVELQLMVMESRRRLMQKAWMTLREMKRENVEL